MLLEADLRRTSLGRHYFLAFCYGKKHFSFSVFLYVQIVNTLSCLNGFRKNNFFVYVCCCISFQVFHNLYISANHLVDEGQAEKEITYEQYDLFTDYQALEKKEREEKDALAKERKLQVAMLEIKNRFGKNAVLKGTSFQEGATGRERNEEIGGHKA